MESALKDILKASLKAADPKAAVLRFLRVEEGRIRAGDKSFEAQRVFILAVGKAAGAMAQGAEEVLGDKVHGGLVVTKEGHEVPLNSLETIIAAHPEPDIRSHQAARRVASLAGSLQQGDLLLTLISGGASALLADAAEGIQLEDLARLNLALLKSGASITEINTVRKHISTLKGGGLARLAAPAQVLALLLSDVVGDDPSSIGSGPTAPDPTTLEDVSAVLKRYEITPPPGIEQHLKKAAETPKPGDPVFTQVTNLLVGSGRLSAVAAAQRAAELGYSPVILSTYITNPAQEIATIYAAIIREVLESGHPLPPPCAIISGGEATVVVRGEGTGGPNQEFALSLALQLEGLDGWAALAVDTDGTDGPTNAAGGLVSGTTACTMRENGVDPPKALLSNDSYPALNAAGALLLTGPTGTNVNDLRVALVDRC